jgi:hypothetical protein
MSRANSFKQSHQVEFKADSVWSNVDYDISRGTNSSSQPEMVHSSHDASNHDHYAIPTSNRYAALSTPPRTSIQRLNTYFTSSSIIEKPLKKEYQVLH